MWPTYPRQLSHGVPSEAHCRGCNDRGVVLQVWVCILDGKLTQVLGEERKKQLHVQTQLTSVQIAYNYWKWSTCTITENRAAPLYLLHYLQSPDVYNSASKKHIPYNNYYMGKKHTTSFPDILTCCIPQNWRSSVSPNPKHWWERNVNMYIVHGSIVSVMQLIIRSLKA